MLSFSDIAYCERLFYCAVMCVLLYFVELLSFSENHGFPLSGPNHDRFDTSSLLSTQNNFKNALKFILNIYPAFSGIYMCNAVLNTTTHYKP
jgi:hypothetical protein